MLLIHYEERSQLISADAEAHTILVQHYFKQGVSMTRLAHYQKALVFDRILRTPHAIWRGAPSKGDIDGAISYYLACVAACRTMPKRNTTSASALFRKESSTKPSCITKKRWSCFQRTPMLTQNGQRASRRKAGLLTHYALQGGASPRAGKCCRSKYLACSWRPRGPVA